ncbi:hypothetical protein J0895_25220 [Phormidium pseudopriestleyi FRX01]|uniref:Uncharacterized protein n=1 Tax=Phormidium pseudopriestleyi FRX01 TaxID=1759528 RepID=A0ABS3FYV3_9CYAN|nr:hypothetical protein [Phormidium pseudopriestleyi]MBO0352324.1 hypothetical protein [Phormidium pseudopriestleyi FRX01]
MNKPLGKQLGFDEVLDVVETLSASDQEMLIDLLKKRLTQKRREEIAANIVEATEEYKSGKARRLTVDEFMAELEES